jgi:Mg-chelatase subunit ChlD
VDSQGDYDLQITQIDTSQFPLVNVYISVRDAAGEPQMINTGKLQLWENGQPVSSQSIRSSGEAGPLTTLLLIDNSGSMNFADKLTSAKEVAREYLDQMRSGDQVGIITFNTQVAVIRISPAIANSWRRPSTVSPPAPTPPCTMRWCKP